MPRFVPTIFVSSTKQDLEDYRQALITTFPGLDVLFRGMEYFGSRTRRPKDVMLQELRECDLYLGILAHRYGSIDEETGWSFTELEYREAIRNAIPTMFFLIDSGHPVEPRAMERDPAKITKLDSLKEEVQANYTTVSFTTPDDLANKAAQAIRRWIDEQATRWRAMEQAAQSLSEREKQFINKLHRGDEEIAKRAIRALKNLRSRAALEHFLALLYGSVISRGVREEILDALNEFGDSDRALDVLLVALRDNEASIRSLSAFFLGERALGNRLLTIDAMESLRRLALDSDAAVREEVGHALGKVGIGYPAFRAACLETLEQLQRDTAATVSDRATRSIDNLVRKFPELRK